MGNQPLIHLILCRKQRNNTMFNSTVVAKINTLHCTTNKIVKPSAYTHACKWKFKCAQAPQEHIANVQTPMLVPTDNQTQNQKLLYIYICILLHFIM